MHEFITVSGKKASRIGQGTWFLGDKRETRSQEIGALRAGIDAGLTLIDTAEMYGNGRSENLVGEAIAPYDRENLFVVSKVLPHNAGGRDLTASCNDTLKRLGTDYLDCYLLHWRGGIPFEETIEGMEKLKDEGKIRSWGVSNMDIEDMEEILALPGGRDCVTNQVLYHLGSRGIEWGLIPLHQREGIITMAYCPLAQGGSLRRGLFSHSAVASIAAKHGTVPSAVLLAFTLCQTGVVPIPRSSSAAHTLANARALDVHLDSEDLHMLDKAFPPPQVREGLDIV